jgi:hypothetical protein
MADYQMLGELLGLSNVTVLGYQMVGRDRIEVQVGSSLAAAVCPKCRCTTRLKRTRCVIYPCGTASAGCAMRRGALRVRRAGAPSLNAWRTPGVSYSLQAFVRTLDNWRESILNYFNGRHSNGFAEGVHLKIDLLNRRGFGYRNVTIQP